MSQIKLNEIEELIKDGAKKAYIDNLFLTGNYTDFQNRVIESLVVITVAQKLLDWAFTKDLQVQLEYPISHFYNGAFPNFIWSKRDVLDNTKFIKRRNHNPKRNKSKRIDIAITRVPSYQKDGIYLDPNLQSLVGLEIKSISKSKKIIENDFLRMANAVELEDSISSNNIAACYCLFYRRLENPKDINNQSSIEKLKKKDYQKWESCFSNLLKQRISIQYELMPVVISEGAIETLTGYYPPEEFDWNEIAELTGLVVCYLVKISRK